MPGAAQALQCVRGPSPDTPALHLAKTPMDEPREDAPETRKTAPTPAAPATTTIEIADADSDAGGDGGPYKNLWVPLVVVPAGIVFAIVAVFALFGSLGGSEKTLAENLALVVSGGKNERQQALFGLTRQVTENRAALAEGREAPWEVPVGFARDVQAAYEGLDPDEYDKMLVFGILLSSMGEARGIEVLLGLLDLTDDQDPEGRVRRDRRGGRVEFADHRPYATGDDPRLGKAIALGGPHLLLSRGPHPRHGRRAHERGTTPFHQPLHRP